MTLLPTAAALVDTGALFKVIWVSAVGGIGVSVAFSLLVLGSARSGEARRGGRMGPALSYGALAVIGLAAVAWAIWRGYLFVVEK